MFAPRAMFRGGGAVIVVRKLPGAQRRRFTPVAGATPNPNTPGLNSYYRFRRAAFLYEEAIRKAGKPEIDKCRRDAERYLQRCKGEGLPKPLLKEIGDWLGSLDRYRADRGADNRRQVSNDPITKRKRGPKEKVGSALREAIRKDIREGHFTPDELRNEKYDALAERYKAKLTSTKTAVAAVLSELELSTKSKKYRQIPTNGDQ